MARVLFITKQRSYPGGYGGGLSSGLFNSARFVADMLVANDIPAKTVDVVDNNSIDREVTLYQPTHVFLEALWVVPDKFDILHRLHPDVKWIIRLHSQLPFIASEGPFVRWVLDYPAKPNVYINTNSPELLKALDYLLVSRYGPGVRKRLSYLPNYYPLSRDYDQPLPWGPLEKYLDVGCFGAIRPLKDQLIQAFAALEFADSIHKRLRLHMNVSRVEGGDGAPAILKNIRALFTGQTAHRLIEHTWVDHASFLSLVRMMDIGLQVSFSETFNIVAADFADSNVPIVGSRQIPWLSRLYAADPTSLDSIVNKMRFALQWAPYDVHALNKVGLCKYDKKSVKAWLAYLN